jgi:transcriptional regulator GlxA family with amidase domain
VTNPPIEVAIIDYPGGMQSALHGLSEMFLIANNITLEHNEKYHFAVEIYDVDAIRAAMEGGEPKKNLQIIIIPPSISSDYTVARDRNIKNWLLKNHARGSIICSGCAGLFMLANTGLLQNRTVTTHWGLAPLFSEEFPSIKLDIDRILINDGDIITAAGLMSWVDLGLELVAQFMNPDIMRQLGKRMIIDTGLREQRYYLSFSPKLDHGDRAVLKAQHYLQAHFHEPVAAATLAELSHLTGRTFLRRFVKATGLKPLQYLQRLRIQKACSLLEATNRTFESISLEVGYEDTGAFRKTFLKIVGLTPRDFKNRFSSP